jgi:hypothetical protein
MSVKVTTDIVVMSVKVTTHIVVMSVKVTTHIVVMSVKVTTDIPVTKFDLPIKATDVSMITFLTMLNTSCCHYSIAP